MRRILKSLVVLVCVAAVPMAAALADAQAGGGPAPGVSAEAQAARDDIKATFGFVPGFVKNVPDHALPGAWEEMKALQMDPSTALPPKMKELVGLAVSAQIPCKYCIYAHTQFARLAGASDAEIREAVVLGSLVRHWSTFLNGLQLDEGKFRSEIAKMLEHGKKMMAGKGAPPVAMAVTSYDSAIADIKQTLGFVPEFLAKFPAAALPGAWKEFKSVQVAGNTAIAPKYKDLIGLAVAAQIPCKYCVLAHTEFARAAGASDAELSEAVAMAALVRHWSTWLNGTQVDEQAFRKDIDALVKGARKAQKSARAPSDAHR
jgi:AhpD family alkylhydroperoxidase